MHTVGDWPLLIHFRELLCFSFYGEGNERGIWEGNYPIANENGEDFYIMEDKL